MDRAVRKARNESLFREVNERVEDTAVRWGTAEGAVAFLCECDDLHCSARVELSIPQYEHVRADPTQFVVVPGHVDPAIEVVTERYPGYEVLTKLGQAAKQAEADDPRS